MTPVAALLDVVPLLPLAAINWHTFFFLLFAAIACGFAVAVVAAAGAAGAGAATAAAAVEAVKEAAAVFYRDRGPRNQAPWCSCYLLSSCCSCSCWSSCYWLSSCL